MTYKLIQREPTPEMIEAGFRSIMDGVDNRPGVSWADETTMAFHAIWDAAPQVDGYKPLVYAAAPAKPAEQEKASRDQKQLAQWLLTSPTTGKPLTFAGPAHEMQMGLCRVKMVDADGNEWTLIAGLREGYKTEAERNTTFLRVLEAERATSQQAQSTAAQEAKDAAQPDWETFAAKVLQASRENLSDVDGGDIQDWAVECGLLVAQMQTETCGEECRCVEYGMDLPWECFRYTPEAAEVVAALSQSAKEIKG